MSQAVAESTIMQQDRTNGQVANHKPAVKTSQVPTDGNCAAGDQECIDSIPPLPPGTLTVESFANYASLSYVAVVGAVAVLYACVCVWKRRRA